MVLCSLGRPQSLGFCGQTMACLVVWTAVFFSDCLTAVAWLCFDSFLLFLSFVCGRWSRSVCRGTRRPRCAFPSMAARTAVLYFTWSTQSGQSATNDRMGRPQPNHLKGYVPSTSVAKIHSPRWNTLSRTRDKGTDCFRLIRQTNTIHLVVTSIPYSLSLLLTLNSHTNLSFSWPTWVSYSNWSNPLAPHSDPLPNSSLLPPSGGLRTGAFHLSIRSCFLPIDPRWPLKALRTPDFVHRRSFLTFSFSSTLFFFYFYFYIYLFLFFYFLALVGYRYILFKY